MAKAKEPGTPIIPALRYDYKAFSIELGKRIRQLRKESGLTLRSLMVDYNYHLTQLQRVERGEGISIPTLLRIAETFQVPVEKLVEGLGLVAEAVESSSKASRK